MNSVEVDLRFCRVPAIILFESARKPISYFHRLVICLFPLMNQLICKSVLLFINDCIPILSFNTFNFPPSRWRHPENFGAEISIAWSHLLGLPFSTFLREERPFSQCSPLQDSIKRGYRISPTFFLTKIK